MHEIEHTVFVFRNGQKILTCYQEQWYQLSRDPKNEHIASLNPRMWIQAHWDTVANREESKESAAKEIERLLKIAKASGRFG